MLIPLKWETHQCCVNTPKRIDSDEAQKSKEVTEVKDVELDTKVRHETKPTKKKERTTWKE